MKLSNSLPNANSDPKSSPTERKRKRSSHQLSSEDVSKQPTIKGAFTNQQKPNAALPSIGTALSPKSKRVRTSDRAAPPTASPAHSLKPSDMYTFTSRHPASNGVVDLTGKSPPASPQNGRRMSAVRPLNGRSNFSPHTGAKKLVVKNLKPSNTWDTKAYLEKIWSQLDAALAIIFSGGEEGFSKEDLYRGVENVCKQGGASDLYSRLYARCKSHVTSGIREPLLSNADRDSVEVLRDTLEAWKQWKSQMQTITGIFFFLDRSYLLSSSKGTLSDLTVNLIRDIVFSNAELKPKVIDGACDLVAADRTKQASLDQDLFKRAVDMFHDLSVYTASFEPRFLGLSQQYVHEWADTTREVNAVPDFVRMGGDFIAKEMGRVETFGMDNSTRRDLLALLEDHLIQRQETYLTSLEALAMLLDRNAVDDLTALYSTLSRRRLGSKLRPAFEAWVNSAGTSLVFDPKEQDMVIRLLSLKRQLDNTWRVAFQRDEALGYGLRESFDHFMNKTKKGDATWGTDNTKVGEMIAKYVDSLLRGGARAIPQQLTRTRTASKDSTMADAAPEMQEEDGEDETDEDAEINIQLDQVLDLFRFVHGKAVFEAFYKKDLARRLLMGRSASADAERSMLARLKTECGAGFTQNLEQMFKDVELAREEMLSYRQRMEDRLGYEKGKGLDLGVNILSAAAWPTYPDIPVVVPADIKRAIDGFELHYKSKHSGRKLDWKHALAHCQMKANFAKGSKELVVSSFQAFVLLLFNGLADGEHLTYQHILSESGLPEAEVKRTLQSLACAKLRPLTKHPKGREINTTDTFTVNTSFENPKYRVKINQVQLKETKEENKETHMRVAEDRNFECQAAVVRIMKSRKTIGHSELVAEVIKATRSRGVLDVKDIKRNIDRLIEKDYMEREEGNTYSYIA